MLINFEDLVKKFKEYSKSKGEVEFKIDDNYNKDIIYEIRKMFNINTNTSINNITMNMFSNSVLYIFDSKNTRFVGYTTDGKPKCLVSNFSYGSNDTNYEETNYSIYYERNDNTYEEKKITAKKTKKEGKTTVEMSISNIISEDNYDIYDFNNNLISSEIDELAYEINDTINGILTDGKESTKLYKIKRKSQ